MNAGEVLERILVRYHSALRAAVTQDPPTDDRVAGDDTTSAAKASEMGMAAVAEDPRRARRRARYDAVVARHQAGESVQAISEKLGLSPHGAQVRSSRNLPGMAGAAHTFGCRKPLRDLSPGAMGGRRSRRGAAVGGAEDARVLRQLADAPASTVRPALRPPSSRHAAWLLLTPLVKLTDEQRAMQDRLLVAAPEVQAAFALIEDFREMLRTRKAGSLPAWLVRADLSPMPELTAFAVNLRRDDAAVEAALTYEWSSGQVEGQVTKTKLVKRKGYGRSKFDLLRKQVLLAA